RADRIPGAGHRVAADPPHPVAGPSRAPPIRPTRLRGPPAPRRPACLARFLASGIECDVRAAEDDPLRPERHTRPHEQPEEPPAAMSTPTPAPAARRSAPPRGVGPPRPPDRLGPPGGLAHF